MTQRTLAYLLAALLPAGPIGLSTALAPSAEAAVQAPMPAEGRDVAARLANVQNAVAEATLDVTATGKADPNIRKAWWGNHGWGRPWRGGWGNGGWGWHNGGWGNGGWGNGGWGNWHPWGNG